MLQHAGAELARQRPALIDCLIGDGLSVALARFWVEMIIRAADPAVLASYAQRLVQWADPGDHPGELLVRRPDGVVLLVPPANSPTINASALFSILLPGNALIVKMNARDGGIRFLVEQIVQPALHDHGFSPDLVSLAIGRTRDVLDQVMPIEQVRTIVFFGNSTAGMSLLARAQQCGKKAVLELDGSDYMIVWHDASLDRAVASARHAFDASTQPCIVPKHFLVHEAIYDRFVAAIVEAVPSPEATVAADPDGGVLVPVGRIDDYVAAVEELAPFGQILCGGYRMDGTGRRTPDGAYIAPTLVGLESAECLDRRLRCLDDEIFFPLVPIIRVAGTDRSIAERMTALVRRGQFGLRLSVWTESPEAIAHFTAEIDCVGLLRFNSDHAAPPVFASPWGGPGRSGGPYGESNFFWEKTSHLQAIDCTHLSGDRRRLVLETLGAQTFTADNGR